MVSLQIDRVWVEMNWFCTVNNANIIVPNINHDFINFQCNTYLKIKPMFYLEEPIQECNHYLQIRLIFETSSTHVRFCEVHLQFQWSAFYGTRSESQMIWKPQNKQHIMDGIMWNRWGS